MAAWIAKRDGQITVRWKFRGRYGRRKVPTRRVAQILIKEIEACHALGLEWKPTSEEDQSDPCISDIIVDRLERGRHSRRPNTIENWKYAYSRFVEFLQTKKPRGKLRPSVLSESNIYDFHEWLKREHGNSDIVAANRVSQISGLWKWADESSKWGEIVPRFVRVDIGRPASPPIKPAASWQQVDMMIEALKRQRTARATAYYKAAALMRYMGIRRKQALCIKWEAFNLEDGSVEIVGELGKSRVERRGRVIPIAPVLIEEMATWGRREGIVAAVKNGDKIPYPSMSAAVIKAWESSGVDHSVWQGQSCHGMRRTFTSELVARGAERYAVELLCGRSTGMGGDVYTDPRFVWSKMADAVALVTKIGDTDTAIENIDRFKLTRK
jgi:integrase